MKKTGLIVLALLLTFSAGVFAADGGQYIQALIANDINIAFNGEAFEPIDEATGEQYVPIIIDGRTYLPVRPIAEAAGLAVNWDGNTRTIYLGSAGVVDVKPSDVLDAHGDELTYTVDQEILNRINEFDKDESVEYTHGFFSHMDKYGSGHKTVLHTDGKYDTMRVTVIFIPDDEETTGSVELTIGKLPVEADTPKEFKESELEYSVKHIPEMDFYVPYVLELPIGGIDNLRINANTTSTNGTVIFGNPQFE